MKKMMKRLKNERGLTLVELLAVIVILAIVGTIGFVYIGGIIDNSKKDAHVANALQIIAAAKLYEATDDEIDATAGVTVFELQKENYIEAALLDPWDKSPYTVIAETGSGIATVTKVSGAYTINNFNTITTTNCTLNGVTEQQLLQYGRDNCGVTGGVTSGG